MPQRPKYHTRQRESFIRFFEAHPMDVYSAQELIANKALAISEATIYRLLRQLSKEGLLKKLPSLLDHAAHYRYNGPTGEETRCLLKCMTCGETTTASCDFMLDLERHMGDSHDFYMNQEKTVIYGVCGACRHRKK